ncbi:MAG: methylmalonyl-CoA mutase family protein, partial [Proteobacteria bacterium]|nr:methylmalonyl-CoA mutase family protein [Pseudomonadota bacterium]
KGGMISCIKEGWLESQINQERLKNQRDLDSGRRPLVGVNRYQIPPEEETPLKIHKIQADEWGARRSEVLRRYRAERNPQKWSEAMARIDKGWKDGVNMVPVLMDALKNKATMGECHEAMRKAQDWSFR